MKHRKKNTTGLESALQLMHVLRLDLNDEQRKLDQHRQIVDLTISEIESQLLSLGIIPNNVK